MGIQDQVCTLEQAKRLKELGVNAPSFFHWSYTDKWEILYGDMNNEDDAPAYNVAELGVMLPTGYDTMRVTEIDWKTEQWHGYDLDGKDFPSEIGYATESECRAAMVLRLLETNEIMSEEINKRLSNS